MTPLQTVSIDLFARRQKMLLESHSRNRKHAYLFTEIADYFFFCLLPLYACSQKCELGVKGLERQRENCTKHTIFPLFQTIQISCIREGGTAFLTKVCSRNYHCQAYVCTSALAKVSHLYLTAFSVQLHTVSLNCQSLFSVIIPQ